jgi:drug/metabolite transporter (DMT)-like permease
MMTYWCGIKSIYYATLANINFGIISCCFICSIIINVTFGLIFFGEKMNLKMVGGIVITIAGIVWISLAKGSAAIKINGAAGSNLEHA